MTAVSGYARIVKYRMNKAIKGQCLWPGCWVKAKGLCPKHILAQSEANKRAYAKRRGKNETR